ncbi:MAG: hypothetical protein ACLQED_01545 [Desulfobaccales bacterium]
MRLFMRLFYTLGLATLLTGALGWPMASEAGPALTLKEVENRLVRGGYAETLFNAPWAVEQGEAIVPLLGQMLKKRKAYDQELGGATGAFPFDALWALGHIPQPSALQVLEQYSAASHDPSAALAVQGWKLRAQEKGPGYGVLTNDSPLLEKPAAQARVVKELKAGQAVKIESEAITNPGEEGPRGGPAQYDQVDLIPSGEKGYISRAGDDFSPFM